MAGSDSLAFKVDGPAGLAVLVIGGVAAALAFQSGFHVREAVAFLAATMVLVVVTYVSVRFLQLKFTKKQE